MVWIKTVISKLIYCCVSGHYLMGSGRNSLKSKTQRWSWKKPLWKGRLGKMYLDFVVLPQGGQTGLWEGLRGINVLREYFMDLSFAILWREMEKSFNAPAVGSDRGCGDARAGSQGRWKIKCQREDPSLVRMVCSGTHVMCAGSQAACRLGLWKLKFSLISLSLHCIVAGWPCHLWEL